MSSVGSQAGGFASPNIPLRQEEARPAIQRLATPPTPTTDTPQTEGLNNLVDQRQVLEQQADRSTTQENVRRNQAQESDSFHSAEEINTTQQEQQATQFAGQILDRKQLEALTKQYTERINQALIADGLVPETAVDKDAVQNQNLASLASQTQLESLDPDAKARNKTETKLQKIFNEGGDKGKSFAAFVRRQISQGELSESMLQLIDDYIAGLKSSSLSASDMVEGGQEPIVTLRGMMAADNIEEHQRFNDNLANLTSGSAGERLDLMAVRNLQSSSTRVAPPQPLRANSTPDSQTTAARYINSISQVTLPAPWDNLMLV